MNPRMFAEIGTQMLQPAAASQEQSPLRFYDFFAGAGLVRLGLGESWRCTWANDIEPRKARVYRMNFGDGEFHLGDVADVKPESLPAPVDMAWASFPCQDLSLAGWRKGMSASRSGTFWAFWRLMDALRRQGKRPPLLVVENVLGLLYGDNFSGLCEALACLGMQFGGLVMDAKRFVPQSRPRVFVLAVDASVDCSAWTSECMPGNGAWVTRPLVHAAMALPPDVRNLWRWWRLPTPRGRVRRLESLIDPEPDGWVEWNAGTETERLLSMMTQANRAKIRAAVGSAERSAGTLYKRMRNGIQRAEVRFDGLSGCLRTPHGGSSRQTIVEVAHHTIRTRLITPRECARLMGVPDDFWLPDSYNEAYGAMGDGVVVPVVAWLAHHLLVPLARSPMAATPNSATSERRPRLARELRNRTESRAADWENRKTCVQKASSPD